MGTTLAELGKTLAYSGKLWHTLAYSCILLHTLTYSGILWHTLAYSGILLHTLAYSGILWHTLAYSGILSILSSVRSSSSHPDLLLIHHHHPTFSVTHRSSTLDFHFLSHYSYIKAIMLYKGNHWTRCAGCMDASWVRLGITNDDLVTWGHLGRYLGTIWG